MPTPPPDELEALLSIVEHDPHAQGAPGADAAPRGLGGLVDAWAKQFTLTDGVFKGVASEVLARHFSTWCVEQGHPTPMLTAQRWGQYLSGRLGLRKGREHIQGHDTRPRMMNREAADYFRGWEKTHPIDPNLRYQFQAHLNSDRVPPGSLSDSIRAQTVVGGDAHEDEK